MSHYTVYILSYSTGICLIIDIAYVPNIVPLNYEFFKVRALSMAVGDLQRRALYQTK